MKTKEVAKKETTGITQQTPPTMQGLVPSDVLIPKLLLMQGTSDFVKERKASLGDLVRSTDATKLGDPDHPTPFIPLSVPQASWILEVRTPGSQRWEFRGMIPRNAANDQMEWRFTADQKGNEVPQASREHTHEGRRVKSLTLYVLLPQDIEAEMAEMKKEGMPDLSKALTPLLVTFRSTSFNAGKEVVTFFTKAAKFRQPGWKYQLELGCFLDKNDQGAYYVFQVDPRSKSVPADYLPTVEYWANVVATSKLRVDDAEDSSGPDTSVETKAF